MGEVPSSLQEYAVVAVAASTLELASSSSACYLRAWRRFLSFCDLHNVHPLPPKVSTINCYFSYLCTNYSFSSVLTARAALKHFFSLRYPGEPCPTDFRSVARVIRGLERKFKKAVKKKNGLSAEVVHKLVRIFIPDCAEICSISNLRNATFFSLLFYASARFSDIVDMNICYVKFMPGLTPYAVLGFNRLKNQRNDSDVGIAYISDIKNDNFSCYKLLQALVQKLLLSGSQEDLLFPAMSGNRVLKRPVTYAAMASIFKKSLAALDLNSDVIKILGLHYFRIGDICGDQLQQAGRWASPEMIGHYTWPSVNSNLLFSRL